MKKIIPVFLIMTALIGCSARTYTPVIDTELNLDAVYMTGDFSYFCKIHIVDGTVSITPTTTYASGMTITYDGKNAVFNRGKLSKSVDANSVDLTNPARLLYETFNYIDTSNYKCVGNTYQYTGKTSAGNFVLEQSCDGSLVSLKIPDANITVQFR